MSAPTKDDLFEPVPNSRMGKVRCRVCGRTGYECRDYWRSWQKGCLRGHAPCPDCGRQYIVKLDGTPRRHTRCEGNPDESS